MQNYNQIPALQDLVLVGGGHSHVQVLKSFGMKAEAGIRLTIICDALRTPYSGMLPGLIDGTYTEDDIHINLAALSRFAEARFIQATVTGLNLKDQRVHLAGRPDIHYDYLSLNTGAEPALPHEQAITVKPISQFLPKWNRIRQQIRPGQRLSVVGGGAGGVELALAARRILDDNIDVQIVSETLLPGHPAGAVSKVIATLGKHRIDWLQARADKEQHNVLVLTDGRDIETDYVLWVTDVNAPKWLAESGIDTDERGFISVDSNLRSISHSSVFASGDVAHLVGQERPKSGVYAVRAGPFLSQNLRRAVTGQALRVFKAQNRHLALLGDGHGSAIASRGSWSAQGKIWWWLKRTIDRRFIARFNDLPIMQTKKPDLPPNLAERMPAQAMRCGGCGAKLAADPLKRVLARLPNQQASHVHLGIGDDAALLNTSASTLLTIDGFRTMLDDPYLFGRIAAHHSLNDIYAMGSRPTGALAFVTVPLMAETLMEEELYQLLCGATDVLNAHDVPLVGGHSAEGLELGMALTIVGAGTQATLLKSGARPGDRLILTKALGTGVILAAAMQGHASAASIDAAHASMDLSNAEAARIMLESGAHALTDITGFGLAGHLGEMLRASEVGVCLQLSQVPVLAGATALFGQMHSSLQEANELALQDYHLQGGIRPDDARVRLLADPQTSGGLLAAVDASQASVCLSALSAAGYTASDVGEVTLEKTWLIE